MSVMWNPPAPPAPRPFWPEPSDIDMRAAEWGAVREVILGSWAIGALVAAMLWVAT